MIKKCTRKMDSLFNENDYGIFSAKLQESLNDENVYAKVLKIKDMEDGGYKYHLSLINEFMFEADQYFFVQENQSPVGPVAEENLRIFRGYHPFIYEFEGEDSDDLVYQEMRQYEGKWIKIQLKDIDSYDSAENDIIIDGTMVFSASPLISAGKRLCFNRRELGRKVVERLNKIYGKDKIAENTRGCVNNRNIYNKFLRRIPEDICKINGIIYEVGNANNIKLDLISQKVHCQVLYDVGCGVSYASDEKERIKKNLECLFKSEFQAVILSHWDLDHILAVGYYNPRILYAQDQIWIAPDINLLEPEECSVSAARLAGYVAKSSMLYLSNKLGKELGSRDNVFKLWQGLGTKKREATHNNNIGLLIEISGAGVWKIETATDRLETKKERKIHALLAGDCPFDNMPEWLKKHTLYDFLITPHHGSDRTVPDIYGEEISAAVICAGSGGAFPGDEHVKRLRENGFWGIYETSKVGNIKVELNVWVH